MLKFLQIPPCHPSKAQAHVFEFLDGFQRLKGGEGVGQSSCSTIDKLQAETRGNSDVAKDRLKLIVVLNELRMPGP